MGRRKATRYLIQKVGERLYFRTTDALWTTEKEAAKFKTSETASANLREFGLEIKAVVIERIYQ